MDNRSTKQKILDAALELFSTQGFEATSVSQIADEVSIRKASVYSHFENKQEILDSLINEVLKQYEWHTVFSERDWAKTYLSEDNQRLNIGAVIQMIVGQAKYIIHDPHISKSRKMLTIEQFRSTMLAQLQTKQNYANVMNYFEGLIGFLINRGIFADSDAKIAAAQLCLPVSVWINLCDREPDREDEVIDLIEKHVRQFFKMYMRQKTAI